MEEKKMPTPIYALNYIMDGGTRTVNINVSLYVCRSANWSGRSILVSCGMNSSVIRCAQHNAASVMCMYALMPGFNARLKVDGYGVNVFASYDVK